MSEFTEAQIEAETDKMVEGQIAEYLAGWQPIPPDKCGECGRATPDYYNARNEDMADAYESGVSSRRVAKAYGISEERTIQIIKDELGRRAYLTAWHEEDRE